MSHEPFEDSRRLTGANLYFGGAGAALETAPGLVFDAEALLRWRSNIARVRAALDWQNGAIFVREHATGASLAFEAPLDQLYTATEANEWALYAALGLRASDAPVDEDSETPRPHVAHFDDDEALRQLRALADAEAKPQLRALIEAAHAHGLPAHADDDALSIGEGEAAQIWTLDALPDIDAVPWPHLRAIPKAVVTGSNGKTTTVRLLAAMLRAHGLRAGYSSTDGLFIDGERVEAGDYSGPVGARTVLRDARVQAAVLETARGGLLRRGLVANDARVAVVTNISADHFGEYGVHTLDDIAAVKLVVAKALAADGVLVLNADDALLVKHAAATGASRIGWFALTLDAALARGALACGVREGRLILAVNGIEHDLGAIADMPLTLGGSARYNIANIAAASLAAQTLGIAPATIAAVLARFGGSNTDNPGRLQRWTLGDVQVLLDYAHNPDGLRGLLQVAEGLRGNGRLALLLGHAGNRLEADFRALAAVAAAAKPDRVWLKDIGGDYLRGKESGQVASIIRDALMKAGMAEDALPVCLDEAEASRQALAWARAGDLLVLPVHEPERRDVVVALLDRLRDEGWRAGRSLPEG
ncbi:Mur ligase family protein [Thermomonas sp. HDW16]|uniref:Mur ligase family protein n=1 Tax=Thermomonas sp. HDW16 TaxID=2714945 RepID=UPI00140E8503|nr:Mur ligase family protein [Thermomonas sp. HDW16]QIL21537.1 Mur ligase [Thermomonas sp. HDW16]